MLAMKPDNIESSSSNKVLDIAETEFKKMDADSNGEVTLAELT